MRQILLATIVAALSGLAGCDAGLPGPRPGVEEAESVELRVVDLLPRDRRDLPRDGSIVLGFSAPLDPASLAPGSVQLIRRDDGSEVPVDATIDGDRLTLEPPDPYGFRPETAYALVVEGFPSLLALRSRAGTPLVETYRASVRTSRSYRPDVVPPRVRALDLETDAPGGWRIRARFSEPVDPDSLVVGRTVVVCDEDTREIVNGRLLTDRTGTGLRFLPEVPGVIRSVRVRLTEGITDRAGNPLHVYEKAEAVFALPERPVASGGGEIAEDFTTRDRMDPAGTTALWNGSRFPGALLAEPSTTLLPLPGDPDAPETFLRFGAEEVRFEMILSREELGIAREITGFDWSPAGSAFVPAEYSRIEVSIAPTTREGLGGEGYELAPEEVLLARSPWRIREEEWDRVSVLFSRAYEYDGASNLRLTIRVGGGDHTNFVRCRASRSGRARVISARGEEDLRPILALRCFSWTPTATSLFYDSGLESPEYLPAIVHPGSLPEGVAKTLRFQGARRVDVRGRALTGEPDALSPWTEDPTAVSGYRFLRFQVVFYGVSLGDEAAIDDLVVPFRRGP